MNPRWCFVVCVVAFAARAAAQVLPEDWQDRDLEGRWVAYRADLEAHAKDPARKKTWIDALGKARELELLEWIAVYEGWQLAGEKLAELDAPQWMRCAVWSVGAADSHQRDSARQALQRRGAAVRGWFERFPVAKSGAGAELYAELEDVDATDPGDQLDPLDGMQVFMPQLEVGPQLEDFGDRLRAESGVRYVHQVLRALGGLPVWNSLEPMHVGKVMALTGHGDARIRGAAFTALSKLPPRTIPWRELWAMTRTGDDDQRRLALLAWSFAGHPQVYLDLHRVALDANDPCCDAAASRLRDIGDAFSERELRAGAAAAPAGAHRDLVLATADAIGRRLKSAEAKGIGIDRAQLLVMTERVVFAESSEDPLAEKLAEWTETELRRRIAARQLEELAREGRDVYAAESFPPAEQRAMILRVQLMLDKLASGSKPDDDRRE